MRISHFFIDRPIFAAVVSIVFVILGAVSLRAPAGRAISRDRAAGHQRHRASIPAPAPRSSPSTVVAPIEQQINGVENMLYMSSNSTGDGRFSIARDVRPRHQSRYRAGAGAEPRRDRAAAPAGRRAQHRRHRRQGLARPDDGRAPAIRPTSRATTLFISNYASARGQGRAHAASTASARSPCSAAATIRCGSGSIPTACNRSA